MGRQVSGDSKLGWALEVVLTKANRGGGGTVTSRSRLCFPAVFRCRRRIEFTSFIVPGDTPNIKCKNFNSADSLFTFLYLPY